MSICEQIHETIHENTRTSMEIYGNTWTFDHISAMKLERSLRSLRTPAWIHKKRTCVLCQLGQVTWPVSLVWQDSQVEAPQTILQAADTQALTSMKSTQITYPAALASRLSGAG